MDASIAAALFGNTTVRPLSDLQVTGGGGKKKPPTLADELKTHGKDVIAFDEKPVNEVVKNVATQMGISPSLLFSSAWQEGMNKATLSPDDISQGYKDNEKDLTDYPVDGFLNYGVDTFGDRYQKLAKYLPADFATRFKAYKTTNEKNQPVNTAAFKTNADALMAKAALMKSEMDNVNNYATKKGLTLDDQAKNYFMLAAYNGGFGNAQKMLDEYLAAKDKIKYINEGLTSKKEIHKHIKSRLDNMSIADELLK